MSRKTPLNNSKQQLLQNFLAVLIVHCICLLSSKLLLCWQVYRLLKTMNVAFKAGNQACLKSAKADISHNIRKAMTTETQGTSGKEFRPSQTPIRLVTFLPLCNLNWSFAQFETCNTHAQKRPPSHGDQVLILSTYNVRQVFSTFTP